VSQGGGLGGVAFVLSTESEALMVDEGKMSFQLAGVACPSVA
jgi:hypothetical protein